MCHPKREPWLSEADWAEQQRKWAVQQKSPFVAYKLVKQETDGSTRDLTDEELHAVEQYSMLAREWLSTAPDRGWVKAALEIMKKVRAAHKDVKLYLCIKVPQPAPLWSPELIANYNAIVFHPNDLGTIETRLKDKDQAYATPDEWMNAVRTVFRNCFVFNAPSDPISAAVLKAAESASLVFEKEMKRLHGVTIL